jgi:hypothetical protein
MKSLRFLAVLERAACGAEKRVRLAQFEARSSLPVSAACVVANGVRETLSGLLGGSVDLRLFEPTIPAPHAWRVILHNARCYRVRGNVADAAIIVRGRDAIALAATLFGEPRVTADRALSPIECEVLDRMVGAIAANLGVVCGARDGHTAERVAALPGFVTYFELLVEEPVVARIGIALSREPSPETGGCVEVGHLAGVKLAAQTQLDAGTIEAAVVARLTVGKILPIEPLALQRCSLTTYGRPLASGSCGIRNGRYAFLIDAMRQAV